MYDTRRDVTIAKKDFKAIIKSIGHGTAEGPWHYKYSRSSVATVPVGSYLVTKDMVPSLARKMIEDEKKETFNG
jgi:hypothetical protein